MPEPRPILSVAQRLWLACVLALGLSAAPAAAQTRAAQAPDAPSTTPTERLLERLAEQRFRAHAARLIAVTGERPAPMPPRMHAVWDSALAFVRPPAPPAAAAPPPPRLPPFVVWDVQPVRKLAREWFTDRYAGTRWAYLGSNGASDLDTTRTWRLRAVLEERYGRPTETVVERGLEAQARGDTLTTGTSLQFAYWFVVNAQIPVVVTDVAGPLDRGLVMASDAAMSADSLAALRQALLEPLAQAARRAERLAPFVDLYHDAEAGRWYLAGYDGVDLRVEGVRRPNLRLGRPYRFPD